MCTNQTLARRNTFSYLLKPSKIRLAFSCGLGNGNEANEEIDTNSKSTHSGSAEFDDRLGGIDSLGKDGQCHILWSLDPIVSVQMCEYKSNNCFIQSVIAMM